MDPPCRMARGFLLAGWPVNKFSTFLGMPRLQIFQQASKEEDDSAWTDATLGLLQWNTHGQGMSHCQELHGHAQQRLAIKMQAKLIS